MYNVQFSQLLMLVSPYSPPLQSPAVEPSLYQHMALLCCAFGFQWSKWNSESGRSEFVVQGCENIKGEPTEKARHHVCVSSLAIVRILHNRLSHSSISSDISFNELL